MPLTGFFKSPSVDDPVLGRLDRSRGLWRGALMLAADAPTPLALFGSSAEPDPAARAAARELTTSFSAWSPLIEQALHEHFIPYGEASAEEDPSAGTKTLAIARADQVWAHVSLHSVAVIRLDDVVTTELVYAAAWDDDHLLGARFQSGSFIELCGSVVPA